VLKYFYAAGRGVHGPVRLAELPALLSAAEPDFLVMPEGGNGWLPVRIVIRKRIVSPVRGAAASRPTGSDSDRKSIRVLAGSMLVVAIAFCYLGIFEPLREMRSGEPRVTYSLKAVGTAPLLLALSLIFSMDTFGGKLTAKTNKMDSRPPGRYSRLYTILLSVIALAASFATVHWFEKTAESLGYKRGSYFSVPASLPVPDRGAAFIPPLPKSTSDALLQKIETTELMERILREVRSPSHPDSTKPPSTRGRKPE